METKQAIQIAVDNGWNLDLGFKDSGTHISCCDRGVIFYTKQSEIFLLFGEIFLDPLFWQALGKGLCWDKQYNDKGMIMGKYGLLPEFVWRGEIHRFIDTLIDGGTPEDYFSKL
jgi:hypothetical protein